MRTMDRSGFDDLDRLLTLVRRTRELLDRVAGEGELPPGGADFLASTTLPHLEGVQAGFLGWLRAEAVDLPELRYLLRQTAATRVTPARDDAERRAALAEAMLERALALQTDRPIHGAPAWDLLALRHARLVLALMPRLPGSEVRFPRGRRTYADIPAPRGPAELAGRIEELERELWRTATGHVPPPLDPGFRRTYGFFDVADRLGWKAFGPAA